MKKVRYALGAVAAAPAVLGVAGPAAAAHARPATPVSAPVSGKVVRADAGHPRHCLGTHKSGDDASGAPGLLTYWSTLLRDGGACLGTVVTSGLSGPLLGPASSVQVRVLTSENGVRTPLYTHRSPGHDNASGAAAGRVFRDHVRQAFTREPLWLSVAVIRDGVKDASFESGAVRLG